MKHTKQAETETKKTQYVALANGSILRRRCLEVPMVVRITGSQEENKAEFAVRYGLNWSTADGLGSCYSQTFDGPGPEVAW